VATIRKEKVPMGLTLGCNNFIIFSEGCKSCGVNQCAENADNH
jgi:hypothetical protein